MSGPRAKGAPEHARRADRHLADALRGLAETGRRTPCGHPTNGRWWTSNQPEDRARAVAGCASCPIVAACQTAADARRERWGVWAGRDRTPRPRQGATP